MQYQVCSVLKLVTHPLVCKKLLKNLIFHAKAVEAKSA